MSWTRVLAVAVTSSALLLTAPAVRAEVVPVDPGPIAADRPIVGTTQNLPALGTTDIYDAGAGFATQIRAYYDSGQARRDQRDVSRAALAWVRQWLREKCDGGPRSCRAMVVFDIDETLLDNYPFYSTLDPPFGYDNAAYNAFSERCGSPAIAPVRRLYQRLRSMNVTLAVVSGRSESLRAATVACLQRRGISGWTRLVLKAPGETALASDFKARVRRSLERSGYTIVASVGDQVSDMAHGALKRGFLLPDPMYFIP